MTIGYRILISLIDHTPRVANSPARHSELKGDGVAQHALGLEREPAMVRVKDQPWQQLQRRAAALHAMNQGQFRPPTGHRPQR